MFRKTDVFGLCFAAALAVVTAAPEAGAQMGYDDHVLHMTEQQEIAAHMMAKQALFIALGVDSEQNLRSLESSRDRFDRVLVGLREGDSGLRLPAPSNPAFTESLEEAQEIWKRMDASLRAALNARALTRDQIVMVIDMAETLVETIEEASESYVGVENSGQLISMLTVTIELVGDLGVREQELTNALLSVAYGHRVEYSRRVLAHELDGFNEALDGLINGNMDLLLLPAPNEEIRAQLLRVQQIWEMDVQPVMRAAARGEMVTAETLEQIARLDSQMIRELAATADLYESL